MSGWLRAKRGLVPCCTMDAVAPNLKRIPADGDARARSILDRAPDKLDAGFLEGLTRKELVDLGRYGVRLISMALRWRSLDALHDALLATAIAASGYNTDDRDLMVGLALPYVVAAQLGTQPRNVFDETATRLPVGPVSDLLRTFGAREDVTLAAFGWRMIETADGPDFIPV
jgi:hypothetical protein